MKRLIWLVLFIVPTVSLADQWLCVADQATGFLYNESSKKWKQTEFTVDDSKYIVAPNKGNKDYKYSVTKIGAKGPEAQCELGFNDFGFLFCSMDSQFKMNKDNGRFIRIYDHGYFNVLPDVNSITDENSSTPLIEIGKCSKF